jgi:hypothetical protein
MAFIHIMWSRLEAISKPHLAPDGCVENLSKMLTHSQRFFIGFALLPNPIWGLEAASIIVFRNTFQLLSL